MNFGAPLTSVNRPSYNEAPGVSGLSKRDSRLSALGWLKSKNEQRQNFSTNQALSKLQQDVNRLRKRPNYVMPQDFEAIEPFSVYQASPAGTCVGIVDGGSDYAPGDVLTVTGGTLADGSTATTATVSTVADDGRILTATITNLGIYTAEPTWPNPVDGSGTGATIVIITSDQFSRVLSMRDGRFIFRPRFGSSYGVAGLDQFPVQNYEVAKMIYCDGDYSLVQPQTRSLTPVVLNTPGTEVLISGHDGDGNYVQYDSIFVDYDSGAGQYIATFWLEIIDSVDSISINLKGWIPTSSAAQFPSGIPIVEDGPTGKNSPHQNVVPIAYCFLYPQYESQSYIDQYIVGSQLDFQQYYNTDHTTAGGLSIGQGLHYRGDWDEDALDGQYFYPGDIVSQGSVVLSKDGGGTFTLRLQYLCKLWVCGKTADGTDPQNDNGASSLRHWICLTGS